MTYEIEIGWLLFFAIIWIGIAISDLDLGGGKDS